MTTIYHAPDRFGLQLVAAHDAATVHAYDLVAVWRDQDGHYYAGHDHGCSCSEPTPFEHLSVKDLTPVRNMADVEAFASGVWDYLGYFSRWGQDLPNPAGDAVTALMNKVAIVLDDDVSGCA